MKVTNRIAKVQDYIFSSLEQTKNIILSSGGKLIDLSIGDPDLPTPDFIKNEFIKQLTVEGYNRYPPYSGVIEFKKAITDFYKRKFDVDLDFDKEVGVLVGSKEGIAHLFLALTDPKDYVLVPNPGYPVYSACSSICGCLSYNMNLSEKNDYLPNLRSIYNDVARMAKMLIINYPNNPTGAVANKDFYKELIEFGIKYDIPIVNDAAYINIVNEDKNSISLMQIDGAKKIAVEIGSLSKTYNMAGWRIGYIVGNSEIIKKLIRIKNNFDSGVFVPIQYAAAEALKNGDSYINDLNKIYIERRKIVVDNLKKNGIHVFNGGGTFYVWFRTPDNYKSTEFCKHLLYKTNVLVTPGNAFGGLGEGFCRISLTKDEDTLKLALLKFYEAIKK